MSHLPPIEPPVKIQRIKEHTSMQLEVVTFKIEDQRFKVPIETFSESKTFYAMLERATTDDPDAEQAIQLDGISKEEFQSFMKYIHQRRLGGHPAATLLGCTAVLKISTKWKFDTVRETVIENFPEMDVVDKIALARDYSVHQWLVPSLNQYAQLGRSITLQDVERLGLNYILNIAQVREKFVRKEAYSSSSEAHQRRTYDFGPSLAELFREEIKRSSIQLPPVLPSAVEDFNFDDIFFLVEDRLFKSCRQYFEDSPVFRTMFSLPVGENAIQDGSTKSQPLRLEGIARSDFACFVDLMNLGPSTKTTFSLPEWVSVLKLSTMWEFTTLRQYAITKISNLSMVPAAKRINLAREYHIQEWLLSSLVAYARKKEGITADDVDLLGWEFVLKILQARERMGNFRVNLQVKPQQAPANNFWYIPGIEARVTHDFTKAIEEAFQEEIGRVLRMYPVLAEDD